MELVTLAFADYDHPDPHAPPDDHDARPHAKRRKINLACEQCRFRKARCDGEKPICGNCTRRKEQCVYKVTKVQSDTAQDYVQSLLARIAILEEENARLKENKDRDERDVVTKMLAKSSNGGPKPLNGSPVAPTRRHLTKRYDNVDAMGGAPHFRERASDDSYFGYSSTSALMEQVRAAIAEGGENSAFLASAVPSLPIGIDNVVFEGDYAGPENFALFPRPITDYLLGRYFDKIWPLYPFIHKPTFMQSYERLWDAKAKPAPENPALGLGESSRAGPLSFPFTISLNAMLVLGLQFTPFAQAEKDKLTFQCISKAKNLLKMDLYNEGSLAILQMSLLVTQYFQSTNSPNKPWTSIGLACRIAQGLGLHMDTEHNSNFTPIEREIRRRTFYTTVILDMITAMALGRPVALRRRHGVPLPAAIDDEYLLNNISQPDNHVSDLLFFHELNKIHRIMREALATLYKDKPDVVMQKFDKTVELDSALTRLEQQLPEALNWKCPIPQTLRLNYPVLEQQRAVLHMRYVAAHFGMHRPLFLDFCRAKIPSCDPTGSGRLTSATGLIQQCQRNGAVICIEASIRLVEIVDLYAGSDATCEWWYNVFFIRMAVGVMMITMTQFDLLNQIGMKKLDAGWNVCKRVLREKLPQNGLVTSSCDGLVQMYEQVRAYSISHSSASSNPPTTDSGFPTDAFNATNIGNMDGFNFMDSGLFDFSTNEWGFGFDDFTGPLI